MSYSRATSGYERYLMYGSKKAPNQRGIQAIDFSLGLVLGFRGREASVPPGYCTRLQNMVARNDGTWGIRPSFFVGPEYDTERFDHETYLAGTVVGTFPDGGILTVNRAPHAGNISWERTGFTPNTATATVGDAHWPGNAAHWGNVSIIPYVYYSSGGDVFSVRVDALTYNSDFTISRSSTNLTTLYDHQPYVYEDVDVVDSVYSRAFAITWKGRGFIIAGTGLSFSAPLNPGNFALESGGGFIPLDTNAPIVGVFVMQDIMYICTEAEVFTLMFEVDPGRDRQIRTLAQVPCRGAAEYDNIGYIATAQGLYRVVGNQLTPTFIPSDQNYFHTKVTGDVGGSVYPLDTDSVFIPRICGVHKFGDVILLAGLGFNADRRFGPPDGERYRYPLFSTTTETWAEWDGPEQFAGGIFTPVNALPVYQGPLSLPYTFPVSHIMQYFDVDKPVIGDRPRQAFFNTNRTNDILEMISIETEDIEEPEFQYVPPFVDVALDILEPSTDDETFALDAGLSSVFEVFLLTGRLPFGAPFTWKRLHRYWIEAALLGAAELEDNSFLFWMFYAPSSDDNSFAEQQHARLDNWLEDSGSMSNQTPGHLVHPEPGALARFTTAQLAVYWKSPMVILSIDSLNSNSDFETNADGWEVPSGSIVHTTDESFEGTGAGLVTGNGDYTAPPFFIPEGVVLGWTSPTQPIPEGWTREDALDNVYLRSVGDSEEPGALSGSATHSHTTDPHSHSLSHAHTTPANTGTAQDSVGLNSGSVGTAGYPLSHTHSWPNVGVSHISSAAASPSAQAIDNELHALRVVWIMSEGEAFSVPLFSLALFAGSGLPDGWVLHPLGNARHLKGALAGQPGGGLVSSTRNHQHEIAPHTHAGTSHSHASAKTGSTASTLFTNFTGAAPVEFTVSHNHDIDIHDANTAALQTASGGLTESSVLSDVAFVGLGFIRNDDFSLFLPLGLIGIWLGALADIPQGWALCNGDNGTVDMFDRYPRGVSNLEDVGQTGGSFSADSHSHNSAPLHSHPTNGHSHPVSVFQATPSSSTRQAGGTTSSARNHGHNMPNTNTTPTPAGSVGIPTNSSEGHPRHMRVAFIQMVDEVNISELISERMEIIPLVLYNANYQLFALDTDLYVRFRFDWYEEDDLLAQHYSETFLLKQDEWTEISFSRNAPGAATDLEVVLEVAHYDPEFQFYIDEASIGVDPSQATFDPLVPKWSESGIDRVYVDVTEYKPSHTGI